MHFPFLINELNEMSWRCNRYQPYCKTLENSKINIRICHRFKSKEEENIEELENLNFHESRFIDYDIEYYFTNHKESILRIIPSNKSITNEYEAFQYGQLLESNEYRKVFIRYELSTNKEFIYLNFSSLHNDFDFDKLIKEINYIIKNIVWQS